MAYMSPRWTREQFDAGEVDAIEIFKDQISGWLFEQADRLRGDDNASVAILSLVTPYFETIACYLKGEESKGHSMQFLKDGLDEVYPGVSAAVKEEFVAQVRNGLFHESIFRTLLLHKGGAPTYPTFDMVNEGGRDVLAIDPWVMLDTVKAHLADYVARLRDQPNAAALLTAFNAFMAIRMGR